MARGDDCKTTARANHACSNMDVVPPYKKISATTSVFQTPKQQEPQKNDYGAWGPVFKDKKNFTGMHFC